MDKANPGREGTSPEGHDIRPSGNHQQILQILSSSSAPSGIHLAPDGISLPPSGMTLAPDGNLSLRTHGFPRSKLRKEVSMGSGTLKNKLSLEEHRTKHHRSRPIFHLRRTDFANQAKNQLSLEEHRVTSHLTRPARHLPRPAYHQHRTGFGRLLHLLCEYFYSNPLFLFCLQWGHCIFLVWGGGIEISHMSCIYLSLFRFLFQFY